MTIAVTAATGHLGRLTVDELLKTESAESIVAVVRNAEKAKPLTEAGVEVRVADYSDRASYAEALRGVDRVLLISGMDFGQRVLQHTNIIEAAKENDVSLIAYTSAPHADTSPLMIAAEHAETEKVLIASGVPFVFLRNGWYTEMFVPELEQARHTGAIWTCAPTGRIASASRLDFAQAAAKVLTSNGHEGQTYELTGDTAWSYDELAQVISEIIEHPISHKVVGPEEEKGVLIEAGTPEHVAEIMVHIDEQIERGALCETTKTLSSLIGRPTTPYAEGLRAALA